jgi:hypothetical protein
MRFFKSSSISAYLHEKKVRVDSDIKNFFTFDRNSLEEKLRPSQILSDLLEEQFYPEKLK